MGDAKSYVEIAIFLVGWIAVVAALKQGQRDLNQKVDDSGREIKTQVGKIERKVDDLATTVGSHDGKLQVHATEIKALRDTQGALVRDTELGQDEMKGEVTRVARLATKIDRWRAAVDQQLKRLDTTWFPPTNGGAE